MALSLSGSEISLRFNIILADGPPFLLYRRTTQS
jgi:hypothetical protein